MGVWGLTTVALLRRGVGKGGDAAAACDEIRWNGIGWEGMAWDGMRWDDMRWHEMAWNGLGWHETGWGGIGRLAFRRWRQGGGGRGRGFSRPNMRGFRRKIIGEGRGDREGGAMYPSTPQYLY